MYCEKEMALMDRNVDELRLNVAPGVSERPGGSALMMVTGSIHPPAAGAIMVVNDFWEMAIDLDCDWIHLGQEDLADADMAAIRRAGLKIGISTHDEEELDRALAEQPDYVALGPVYPTILKKMKWVEQGLDRVQQWKNHIGDLPLVGIGGMTIDRAAGVYAAGADILSVVTDITLNENPEDRLKGWVKATR